MFERALAELNGESGAKEEAPKCLLRGVMENRSANLATKVTDETLTQFWGHSSILWEMLPWQWEKAELFP